MIVQPVDIVVVADSENGETEQLFLTKESEFAENIIGESKEITTDIKDFEEHEDEPVVASTPSTNTTLQPSEIETPEPIVESTPQPTAIPTTTSTPHPMTAPEPTPIPTPEPTPTPTPVQQFDINYWTGFAQNYAQSIGLVLESSAVDCWDNPIPAGYHCKNIEQNITDRLNRYKNLEGFTDVCIWSVETGANTYDIYIGYA